MALAKSIEKVFNQLAKYRFLLILPIFSGLLLGIGFILPWFRFLIWFSLLPLFFFLNSKEISAKQAFLAGFLTGFIFLGQVMAWSFGAFPLVWLGIENKPLSFFLIFLVWFVTVGFLSIFVAFFVLSYWKFKKNHWSDWLLVPSLWIIFEYLRAFGFGVLWWGEESLFGPHWTFGNLAYSLAENHSFRLLAGLGGIYLVSFLVVLVNVLIFFYIRKSKKIIFLIFILILLSYFLPLAGDSTGNPIVKIAVLQTKFPSLLEQTPGVDLTRFQTQQDLAREAFRLSSDLDVLVLPENAQFLSRRPVQETLSQFSDKEFLVIDSQKSIATLYHSQKGSLGQYQKLLLVPYGDYFPYLLKWPGQLINKKWVEKVESKRTYQKGKEPPREGILFCSEVVSPVLYRQAGQKGVQVLFNLGSLAFAQGSEILDSQTQTMLQFRAAENGRYLIRATNYGSSYIIDNKGKILAKTPNFENQVLFGEIQPISKKTFYAKYGDWILVVTFLVLLLTKIFNRGIINVQE